MSCFITTTGDLKTTDSHNPNSLVITVKNSLYGENKTTCPFMLEIESLLLIDNKVYKQSDPNVPKNAKKMGALPNVVHLVSNDTTPEGTIVCSYALFTVYLHYPNAYVVCNIK